MYLLWFSVLAFLLHYLQPTNAQVSKYQPCPLLGPYLPIPQIDATFPALKSAFDDFTSYIDSYIKNGTGEYGPITPNTTSFSVAIFAGTNYIPDESNPTPYFYEYHHTASEISGNQSSQTDADSIYAIGDLTQIFTTLLVLIEQSESAWSSSIVEYISELRPNSTTNSTHDTIEQVDWSQVTLGDLAGHLAGIARISGVCQANGLCNTSKFLKALDDKAPIELPGSTPIYSHAAFQLLAIALERKTGKSLSTLIKDDILNPLQMRSSSLLQAKVDLYGDGLSDQSVVGEPASLGLASTIADLSRFGHAVLASQILPSAQTRRWLQPVASTSNLRNAVGRPWDMYHFSDEAIDPITDVYTKTGSIGKYTSYLGVVPSLDVGFTILAVDTKAAADLNAIADVLLGALLQIQDLGRQQTEALYTGTYHNNASASNLKLELTGQDPGIRVSDLIANGTDWLASIAKLAGVKKTSYLDMRFYPTSVEQIMANGKKQVFQGVIQDKSALADAGTPTCVSWMTVDELEKNGQPLDRFVFEIGDDGMLDAVEWPALGLTFSRTN